MKRMHLATAVLASSCAFAAYAAAPQDHGKVEVTPAVHQDSLPSLRDIVPAADGYQRWRPHDEHHIPLPFTPADQADGAVQNSARFSQQAPTPVGTGFDGVGKGFPGFTVQYAPPDTVGAVGATQYVQVVNVGLAVFNKSTGAVVYGPVPTSTLWQGFGGQ